jgi:hypothetical protein
MRSPYLCDSQRFKVVGIEPDVLHSFEFHHAPMVQTRARSVRYGGVDARSWDE